MSDLDRTDKDDQTELVHKDQDPQKAVIKHVESATSATVAEYIKTFLPALAGVHPALVIAALGAAWVLWPAYKIRRWSKYLEELAFELDANDPHALASLLEQNADKDWFAENIEQGFQKMMNATNPFARKAILLLVADYMRRRDQPDLDYRRVGELFAESDEAILRMIHRIGKRVCGYTQAGIFAYRKLELPSARYAVAGHKGAFEVDLSLMDLAPAEDPDDVLATCDAMIRTGFASPWFGDPTEVVRVSEWPMKDSRGFEIATQDAVIEHHQNRLLRMAMKYIDPVVQNPPKAEETAP